jgi:hypothetical protein
MPQSVDWLAHEMMKIHLLAKASSSRIDVKKPKTARRNSWVAKSLPGAFYNLRPLRDRLAVTDDRKEQKSKCPTTAIGHKSEKTARA